MNEEQKRIIDREIVIGEFDYVLKKSKNNKVPGPDGFLYDFLKVFWDELKFWMLQAFRHYL